MENKATIARNLAERFALPLKVVENALTDTVEAMRERYAYYSPIGSDVPDTNFPRHDRFAVRIVNIADAMEAYVDYLDVVDPSLVVPSEPEDGIRKHPSFARYVSWCVAGHLPPYPAVFEQIYDGRRKLIGANRRRILAAQEAGIKELPVWLGRWNLETGLPLKYGDLIKAAA